MRLFCFSDLHQKSLPGCEPPPDAWLFGGDIYDKPARGLSAEDVEFRQNFHLWREAHPQPVYSVRGNHDIHDRANFFKSSIELTDGVVRHLGNDLYIAGVGWAGQQYFDLPLETHLIDRCQRIEDEWAHMGKGKRLLLLSHYPPHDRALIPYSGENNSFFFDCIRDLILELRPLAAIVSHSHIHFGHVTRIENSVVLFPGRTGRMLTVNGDHVDISQPQPPPAL